MLRIIAILSLIGLTACNSIYVKPNSLDPDQKIFVPRGGYSMKRSVKLALQNRNYNVHVGRLTKRQNHLTWISKPMLFPMMQNILYASKNAVKYSVQFGACLMAFGGGILMYPLWNKNQAQKFYHGADVAAKTVRCVNWTHYWTQWK